MIKDTGHYYLPNGQPFHFVPKKDGKGTRPTTIADARREGAYPSVTTILQILDKPALKDWLIRQAVMAVVTAPDVPGEDIDAKITRVLDVERDQEQEAKQARDWGTMIHDALEAYFTGQEVQPEMRDWIGPICEDICRRGQLVCAEKVLVGNGYAGRTDLILEASDHWLMLDWKTTKKLPEKGAWPEHVLQLAAYAAAYWHLIGNSGEAKNSKPIRCANCYISSVDQGKYLLCHHDHDWQKIYNSGFVPLFKFWCYWRQYTPTAVIM